MKQFSLYYSVKTDGDNAILYKSVNKNLTAFYDNVFSYKVGETIKHKCDNDLYKECSEGLHISYKDWAIRFGKDKTNSNNNFVVLECSVPLDKIVLPKNSDGKVRTSELTVLRILPEEEWETKCN